MEETSDVRLTLANRMPSRVSVAASEAGETPETPNTDGQEIDQQEGAEPAEDVQNGTGDKWRLDKHGNPLSPPALYMRFYRSIRSIMANNYSKKC